MVIRCAAISRRGASAERYISPSLRFHPSLKYYREGEASVEGVFEAMLAIVIRTPMALVRLSTVPTSRMARRHQWQVQRN